MKHHLAGYIRPVLVLLMSVLGLCLALPTVRAEDKPAVLLIARDEQPFSFGEQSVKIAIDKEVATIVNKLSALGYTVDVASEDGKDIQAAGSTLKVSKKLAEVDVAKYVGVIIPCMVHGNVPPSAVKIIQDMQSKGLPVAAQNGGVLVLGAAGVLKDRNYSVGDGLQIYVHDGVFKGVSVVKDGNILTSGTCSFSAQANGTRDLTDDFVTAFAGMLKK
jgi:putative intracellular protease/amidase